jgi:hypothetical protein
MTEHHNKARRIAEKAFDKTKPQGTAQDRAREERDLENKARQEKTARLREARLALENQNGTAHSNTFPDASVKKP